MKKNGPVPGHRARKMITLTDPSIMCSVPLQLEKILDVLCQPKVWGDKWGEAGGRHTPDRGGENAEDGDGSRKDAFKANPSRSATRE